MPGPGENSEQGRFLPSWSLCSSRQAGGKWTQTYRRTLLALEDGLVVGERGGEEMSADSRKDSPRKR